MPEKRKKVPKQLSLDTPKFTKFCPACGDELGKRSTGLCASCTKSSADILKDSTCVVYCRKCKKFRKPDQRKDGLLVRNTISGTITVLTYDDELNGCHTCRDELSQDQPHPVLTRLLRKPNEVA